MKKIPVEHSGFGMLLDSVTGKQIGLKALNHSIIQLYLDAYTWNMYDRAQIVLDVKKPDNFERRINDSKLSEWEMNNLYCYELLVPQTKLKLAYQIMKDDLDRYFNIKSGTEKRTIDSLVLSLIILPLNAMRAELFRYTEVTGKYLLAGNSTHP